MSREVPGGQGDIGSKLVIFADVRGGDRKAISYRNLFFF